MDPSAASSYRVKSEIQPQPQEIEYLEDEIFNAAMENNWTQVQKLYMEKESLRTTKLTRSEDTALHLAISSYHPDRYTSLHHPHLLCIKDMITRIPKENRECILKQKNEKGNTPLHLAAEVGSVPIIECLVNSNEPELIKETNEKGETPLFITASRGKQDAFLYLHKCCQNEHEEGPIELCRRKDGDNILHVAISGEYFELAFQIIHYYKPLVNRYNTQGMSPLHILSRMPQVFRSGNRFRFIDSIIYYSTTVKELENETYKAERKIDLYQKIQRCGTKKFIDYIKEAYRGNKSKDLTGVTNVNQETKPQDATGVTNENQDKKFPELPTTKETPLLVASKMGILEMVKRILKKFPIAIQDTDSEEKNILLLAVEHRQTMVYNWLIEGKYPESVYSQEDKHGNNAVHITAKYQNLEVWRIPGKALQLQGEWKWYKYVKHTLPQLDVRYNKKGQTPRRVFEETHAKLLVESTEWISKTAASLAALIATVAFVTSTTIPGEADVKDKPHLENEPAFDVFSIASLVSLCFSVTALVFFLAILTSRCQHKDFEKDLPRKLLLGLISLFASITATLVSFCAAHFFVIRDNFKNAAFPIYAATCIPVVFFAFNQFPLFVDLIRSYIQKLPLRSYKVFYTISSEATSSDQKKEKEEDIETGRNHHKSRVLNGFLL
ncbi:hypothetical protein CQW23_29146 [Capsicum baccatum]|uniref:PGG domain-containing protein n=1 Tax=Capsicum baccatum TaxID=33114 RepID=A0A2G2VIN5_CAPBA|nr:hypothetical protein CQW23_29146 [Capsicum baccatum]